MQELGTVPPIGPLPYQLCFFGVKKRGQLVPNMGKHRAKQELETVPPQELGTVPPRGEKKGLGGGTVSNYPVGLFLTLDLLLAAVGMIFVKNVVLFLDIERAKKWYQN